MGSRLSEIQSGRNRRCFKEGARRRKGETRSWAGGAATGTGLRSARCVPKGDTKLPSQAVPSPDTLSPPRAQPTGLLRSSLSRSLTHLATRPDISCCLISEHWRTNAAATAHPDSSSRPTSHPPAARRRAPPETDDKSSKGPERQKAECYAQRAPRGGAREIA